MFDAYLRFGMQYDKACRSVEDGHIAEARDILQELSAQPWDNSATAMLENSLGVLDFLAGDCTGAIFRFRSACELDAECLAACANSEWVNRRSYPSQEPQRRNQENDHHPADESPRKKRIAILSLLFNWPSTGGGTIHTAETGRFLEDYGYDVRHWYARFAGWGVGAVTEPPLLEQTEAIEFDSDNWTREEVIRRFREALKGFEPDFVIITDSWSFKPLLAEAAAGYRYFLRLAAQECLCPLNNVRLLIDNQGRAKGCCKQQLATPTDCRGCVAVNHRQSGWLHQQERALSGYGTADYDERLRKAFSGAEGILVVNPLIAAQIGPFAKAVHVVPSGFDVTRFPSGDNIERTIAGPLTIFFAGVIGEYMKGFHVLLEATRKLWGQRQDFRVVLTADPADGPDDAFLQYIGWQSQSALPSRMSEAAFVVFPTIAEEGLGRSAIEAMGAGRPVVASRIGGLPFTVQDEITGLLFEPGNSDDLMFKISRLLDSPDLRRALGKNGRAKFDREHTWPVIIESHYRALLGSTTVSAGARV